MKKINNFKTFENSLPMSSSPWISCTEQMPKDNQYVLAYLGQYKKGQPNSPGYDIVRWSGDKWETFGPMKYFKENITHWMQLPEAPNSPSSDLN